MVTTTLATTRVAMTTVVALNRELTAADVPQVVTCKALTLACFSKVVKFDHFFTGASLEGHHLSGCLSAFLSTKKIKGTMEVPFILMTIACAILILTEILQHRRNKRLTERLEEINEKGWKEIAGIGKVYRRRYKYMVIENAGDNGTLNRTAEKYHDEGYDLDREKSPDRLLVFVKSEEVKED